MGISKSKTRNRSKRILINEHESGRFAARVNLRGISRNDGKNNKVNEKLRRGIYDAYTGLNSRRTVCLLQSQTAKHKRSSNPNRNNRRTRTAFVDSLLRLLMSNGPLREGRR